MTTDETTLSEQLAEAKSLIRALLGAPPPRVWKKWPNVYRRAVDFLHDDEKKRDERRNTLLPD